MNKQVYLGLLALLNLAVLQAADGPDVQINDKDADCNWVELPTNPNLCVADQGRISESVNLKQVDIILQTSMENLLEEARKQDVPWVLSAYYTLDQGRIQRRYADAVGLWQWRESNDIDPGTRAKIICSDYYGLEYVDDKLDIAYLGTDDEANKQGTLLHLLLNYPRVENEKKLANFCLAIGKIYARDKKDNNRELKWCKKAANKGLLKATYVVGLLYHAQDNKDEALGWYKQAADEGYVDAMNNLGFLYNEQGNKEEAGEMYKKAADKGHVGAMANLGFLYNEQGNKEEAGEMYKKAADKGHVDAMNNLGILYNEQGNKEKAGEMYKKAADKGHVGAMNNLGFLYEKMGNKPAAEKMYEKAIGQEYVFSLINIFCLNGVEEAKLLKYAEKFNELVKTDNIELIKYKKSYSERYKKALKNAEEIVSKKRKRCDDSDDLHDCKRVK